MLRRTVGNRNLSEKEILELLQNLSETDSVSDEKSDFSQDKYIPDDESEPASAGKCSFFTETVQNDFSSESENEENSLINIDSRYASNTRGRRRLRLLNFTTRLNTV